MKDDDMKIYIPRPTELSNETDDTENVKVYPSKDTEISC